MKLVKRDGVWYVPYKTPDGKWRRATCGTKDRAEADKLAPEVYRKATSGDIKSAEATTKDGKFVNLYQLLGHVYATHWSKLASDVQLRFVVPKMQRQIGHWLLADLPGPEGYKRLKTYRDSVIDEEGRAPATANRRMSLLTYACGEGVKEGHLSAMPVFPETAAENNITDRYLSEHEEEIVVSWVTAKAAAEGCDPEGSYAWRYMRDLVIALLDTGARLSEMLKLRECDGVAVIFRGMIRITPPTATTGAEGKVVSMRALKKKKRGTKNTLTRRVPLTPRAAEAIKRLLANPLHGTPEVKVKWVGDRWMRVRLANHGDVDVRDVNVHILRHTFACRLLERGVDLYTVSKLLGHSSITVTERYAFLVKQEPFDNAIRKLASLPLTAPVPVLTRAASDEEIDQLLVSVAWDERRNRENARAAVRSWLDLLVAPAYAVTTAFAQAN